MTENTNQKAGITLNTVNVTQQTAIVSMNQYTQLNTIINETNVLLGKQQTAAEKSAESVNTLQQSYSQLTEGLIDLGIVTGDLRAKMLTVNHVIKVFAGLANAYKLMDTLAKRYLVTKVATAGAETYTSILRSPWKAAAVGAALGATAGVAGALLMTTNNSNTTNQIIIENTPDNIKTSVDIYAVIGGGSL